MKIIHIADIHSRDKDIEELEKCLNFVLETAEHEQPDLAIIAGDIYDSQDVKLDSLAAKRITRFVSGLADICPVAIVIGTPSHDGNAAEVLRFVRANHFVTVASKPEQHYFYRGELYSKPPIGNIKTEAVVTLIPQPTKQYFQGADHDISAAMSAVFMGFGATAAQHKCPHILVGHWNVSGAKLSNGQTLTGQEIDISVDQMMLANPDLICLGHIHLPQQLGDRAFFAGSLYAKDWGENHEHGFYVHDLDTGISRFLGTPCKKMVRVQEDFTNGHGGIEDLAFLPTPAFQSEWAGAIVRCDFKVYQDEAAKIDKENIREYFLGSGAWDVDIRIIRIPRATVRSEKVLKLDTLRDKIREMAAIKEDQVCETILKKADMLEDIQADALLAEITGGAA